MRLFQKSILVAALLLVVSHFAPALAAGEISAAEIRKLIPGKYLVTADFIQANVALSANGKISGITSKGDKDTGVWTISGNRICVTFKYWLDGKQKCSSLFRDGSRLQGPGFHATKI